MKTESFTVNSHQELLSHLQGIDIAYPPISQGAAKEQIERAATFRLLSTFSEQQPFKFPLKVDHDDKPDFRFTVNGLTIGAECTMAMPKQFGEAQFLRDKHYPNAPIDLSDFRWGTPDRTASEILELLSRNRLTGMPWFGDSVEREWSQAMMDCLIAKTENLNARDFRKFQVNWLLIDDNVPQANLSINTAVNYLMQPIKLYFDSQNQTKFDTVFIKTHRQWIRISSTKCDVTPVNDLWQKHGG
jgi:hypothetical protein